MPLMFGRLTCSRTLTSDSVTNRAPSNTLDNQYARARANDKKIHNAPPARESIPSEMLEASRLVALRQVAGFRVSREGPQTRSETRFKPCWTAQHGELSRA